jgi:hypothetical protein
MSMAYVTPCCGKPTLPPAVMPGSYRLCSACGAHVDPNAVRKVSE